MSGNPTNQELTLGEVPVRDPQSMPKVVLVPNQVCLLVKSTRPLNKAANCPCEEGNRRQTGQDAKALREAFLGIAGKRVPLSSRSGLIVP